MAPPIAPQVVVSVSTRDMKTNFQGAYAAGTTYSHDQWVSNEEALWACSVASSKGVTPAAGSPNWKLLGALPV